MQTTARMPWIFAASATPCAWLPAEEQTTPRRLSSSDISANLLSGPRILYEPTRWKTSALRRTSWPVSSLCWREVNNGVCLTCGAIRARAARKSSRPRVNASSVSMAGAYNGVRGGSLARRIAAHRARRNAAARAVRPSYPPRMPRTTLALASLLLALGVRAALAPPAETAPPFDEAFIRQFAATYAFRLGTPQETAIAPDGDVLFTRTGPRSFVGDLYERDSKSGEVRRVLDAETLLGGGEEQLSAEEKARRERIRKATRGIGGFELSKDGSRLLVPLSDRLFLVERDPVTGTKGGKVSELATGDGFPYDPQLAPAADRVAFVVDGDLWVVDARPGAQPRRLTTRPGPDVENAVAEF